MHNNNYIKDSGEEGKNKDRERMFRDRERKKKEVRSSFICVWLGSTPVGVSHISNIPGKGPTEEEKHVSSKDNSRKQEDENKKVPQPSPQMSDFFIFARPKSKLNSASNSTNKLSEVKQNNNHSDTSNSSFPNLVVPKPAAPQFEEMKPEKKHHKGRDTTRPEKESKKRKRKSKDDPEPFTTKKTDKSKDKDKHVSSKDKSRKQEDENKKVPQPSPQMSDFLIFVRPKSKLNSVSNSTNKLSEVKQNNNHSDTSNSSFPDLVVPKPAAPQFEEMKPEKKHHKGRDRTRPEKESKKRKRKSKDDPEPFTRMSVSPIVNPDLPPNKQVKKEEVKVEKPGSPILSGSLNSSQPAPHNASPRITNNSPVFRTPSSAPISMSLAANNSNDRGGTNVDYMSELRELHHKIMTLLTLQDNNELQQIVEMIAATGRLEITSKTYDFDLCALDRTTVQRLQDLLATSVSSPQPPLSS